MKTQMSVKAFTEKVLPLLKQGCKDEAELHEKAVGFLEETDLLDDEDKPVQIDDLELGTIETKEPEQDDSLSSKQIESIVEKAVTTALAKNEPHRKRIIGTPMRGDQKIVLSRKRWGPIKNFKGTVEVVDADGKSVSRNAEERAYRFGAWGMAMLSKQLPHRYNFPKAVAFCEQEGLLTAAEDDRGMVVKVHQEGVNTAGGYLVPDEFSNDMIDLRLQYGVFRRNADVRMMSSDTYSRPRRTGGLTAYFVAESAAGTQSTKSWDRVQLVAKKLMVLSKMSTEVNEDAVINLGDDLAGEIAYAFANKEDDCGFNGTGAQATYGGILGVRQALYIAAGSPTTTSPGGLTLAAASTGSATGWPNITLVNFNTVISTLPTFARRAPKWYVSPAFNDGVMQKLAYAAGGNTVVEITDGGPRMSFLGYPVELVEVMPIIGAATQVCALFGDLALAADFGDRRSNTIAFSDSALNAFEQDELVIRGTERFDINVHDVGNTTTAGPIVGLYTTTS